MSSTLQLPCPSFLRGGFLFLSFSFIIESWISYKRSLQIIRYDIRGHSPYERGGPAGYGLFPKWRCVWWWFWWRRFLYFLKPWSSVCSAHFYVGYFSFGKEPKANFPINKLKRLPYGNLFFSYYLLLTFLMRHGFFYVCGI